MRAAVAGAGTAVAVAIVIALAIGGTVLNRSEDPTPGPIDHPPTKPHETQTATPTTARPIVYSDDPLSRRCDAARHAFFCVGTLHVGDREVEIDQAVRTDRGWPMHVTDTGVVYPNAGGLWFTDGSAPRQLARQVCSSNGYPDPTVATESAGPLAAWVDCATRARGDLVVFDTSSDREVDRLPIPGCRAAEAKSEGGRLAVEGCRPVAVVAGHVYFTRAGLDPNRNTPAPRLLRLDIATGDVLPATSHMYARDLSFDPRALVVGHSRRAGTRTTGVDFDVVGTRLVPVEATFDSVSNESVPTRTSAFDAVTGQPVQLRLPAAYHPGPPPLFPGDAASSIRRFSLFEWLADDTVALAQLGDNNHMGDIITCRLSEGACHLVAKAPPSRGPTHQPRLVAGQSLP